MERNARDLLRVDLAHESRFHRLNLEFERRLLEKPLKPFQITTMRRNHLLEFLKREPLLQFLAAHGPRLVNPNLLRKRDHHGRQLDTEIT